MSFENDCSQIEKRESRFSRFLKPIWNKKRREFLGRDGIRWTKLAIFYFFFYFGLGIFFCLMFLVFMKTIPRTRPRYSAENSSMNGGSTIFSPGLGFRPQADLESNLIFVNKTSEQNATNRHAILLDRFIKIRSNDENFFSINSTGDCRAENEFSFPAGSPCVLIKINKIFDFKPKSGFHPAEKNAFEATGCKVRDDRVLIRCYGEFPFDEENLGPILYVSEDEIDDRCGSIKTKWFENLKNSPYIWAQFLKPTTNVLLHVVCRLFAENVHFDKIQSLGSTRFSLYVNEKSQTDFSQLENFSA